MNVQTEPDIGKDADVEACGPAGVVASRYLAMARRYAAQPECSIHLHHLVVAVELGEDYSFDLVARTLQELVRANPALRTRFANRGGRWDQQILRTRPLMVQALRLDGHAGQPWRERLYALLERINHVPLDLEFGALLQAWYVTDGRHAACVLKVHHTICDGYSLGLIAAQFRTIAAAGGTALDCAPEAARKQLLGHFLAEQGRISDGLDQANLSWLKARVGDHPWAHQGWESRRDGWLNTLPVDLGPAAFNRLSAAAQVMRVPLGTLLYTAFAQATQAGLAMPDLLICYQRLNRPPVLRRLVADVSDLVLTRYARPPGQLLVAAARSTRHDLKAFQAHREPYWRVVEALNPPRYGAPMGISPLLFNFLALDLSDVMRPPQAIVPVFVPLNTRCTLFDLLCNVVVSRSDGAQEAQLAINLRYNDAMISRPTALAIADTMTRLLADVGKSSLLPGDTDQGGIV